MKSLESSKAPLNPSPGYAQSTRRRRLRGLDSTPNILPHPKCHSALYRGSSPPGGPKPRTRSLVPKTGLLLEGQEKLAVNQQPNHLPTAAPPPPSPRPLSTPQGMFASRGERLRAPSSSGSFQSGAGAGCKGTELAVSRTLSQQELPASSGSC